MNWWKSSKPIQSVFLRGGLGLALSIMTLRGALAQDWIGAVINNPQGGALYREAQSGSEKLGTYDSGTQIKVYIEPQEGFYSIYLSRPWKGARYVWISEKDIKLTEPSSNTSRSLSSAQSTTENSIPSSTRKVWAIEPRLGYTSYNFQQTGLTGGYQMTALTGQLAASLRLTPWPILVGGDVSYTLLPISQTSKASQTTTTSTSSTQQTSVRLLKSTIKAGLILEFSTLRLLLAAGGYINSLTVSDQSFGYSTLGTVGAFPEIAITLSPTFELMGYFKYIPNFKKTVQIIETTWGGGLSYLTSPDQKLTGYLTVTSFQIGDLAVSGTTQQAFAFELGYQF